jgi:hypothetical protein
MQEVDLGQRQRGFDVGQAIGRNARHQVDHKIKVRAVTRVLNLAEILYRSYALTGNVKYGN